MLISFLFVTLVFPPVLQSQGGQVEGNVYDAKTKKPLQYASVFIDGTTLGATTDAKGHYNLTNVPMGSQELVASFVGYEHFSKKVNLKPEEPVTINIGLVPVTDELREVNVTASRDIEWEKDLETFRKIFLGNDQFGQACKINNPWVIDFKKKKSKGKNEFIATSSAPIEIENFALGYHVSYNLVGLESDKYGYNIYGKSHYQNLETLDSAQAASWVTNRAKAFLGSSRHLFKAILDDKVEEDGFQLYVNRGKSDLPAKLQITFAQRLGHSIYPYVKEYKIYHTAYKDVYTIAFFKTQKIEVHYTRANVPSSVYPDVFDPVSSIEVKGPLFVNSQGAVLNSESLVVYGAMAEPRIASLLPGDYVPQNLSALMPSPVQLSELKTISLQEKTYLHTDKAYYYPGERIWFKAYMNYRTPLIRDSLSRVLYVELIASKKIIASQALKIEDGVAMGAVDLPGDSTGNYFLRAYTLWMLNYPASEIFYKQIPVLDNFEKPSPVAEETTDTLRYPQIKITPDKLSYHPLEKIALTIEVKGEEDNIEPSNLSISVTDIGQVEPIKISPGILEMFGFQNRKYPLAKPVYSIEPGITLSGTYTNRKGHATAEDIIISEEKSKDLLFVKAKSDGHFEASGFQFMDSVTVGFQYFGPKRRIGGHVELIPRKSLPCDSLPEPKPFSVIKIYEDQSRKYYGTGSENTILLRPIIVEAKKLKKKVDVFGGSDYVVEGETLATTNPLSIIDGLQALVPGMRVYTSGFTKTVSLIPPISFEPSGEPLLILNGQQANITPDITINDFLSLIPPEQVDHVEIIKFGGASLWGARGANGVILVYTKTPDYANLKSTASLINVDFFQKTKSKGYASPPEFKAPDYGGKSKFAITDKRSTVYWNQNVYVSDNVGTTVSFYAADLSTRYLLVVEGVTAQGTPLRSCTYITIKK
jgi:hypothetical protein